MSFEKYISGLLIISIVALIGWISGVPESKYKNTYPNEIFGLIATIMMFSLSIILALTNIFNQ